MKTRPTVILFVFSIVLLFSCTKKEGVDQQIEGKWQMQEVYSGYANGGNFQWTAIPTGNQSQLEFLDNGTFIQTQPTVTSQQCTGTFQLINKQEIQLTSMCSTLPSKLEATITNEGLIITYQVREGEIKEKYIKVD